MMRAAFALRAVVPRLGISNLDGTSAGHGGNTAESASTRGKLRFLHFVTPDR
jgi:hypothetical protein